MPSPRRVRIITLLTLAAVLYILYLTSSARRAAPQTRDNFYSRTKTRLTADGYPISSSLDKIVPSRPATGSADDDALAQAMSARLRDAEAAAKERANAKAPTRESVMDAEPAADDGERRVPGQPHNVVAELAADEKVRVPGTPAAVERKDRNVAGRKKFSVVEEPQKKVAEESEADKDVTAELNRILKMSPIIIFSKSYCPHSKRAKRILLTKYALVPAPHVVELDEHPLGAALQARLAAMTGRRTVPNVLVKGKSIGGGDDVAELDEAGTLGETVRALAGKQMVGVALREAAN